MFTQTLKMKKRGEAFWSGWRALNDAHKPKVKDEIMYALNLTTISGFQLRRRGVYRLSPCEKGAIERIFKEYGVTNPRGE